MDGVGVGLSAMGLYGNEKFDARSPLVTRLGLEAAFGESGIFRERVRVLEGGLLVLWC